jgi:hypothetical protein
MQARGNASEAADENNGENATETLPHPDDIWSHSPLELEKKR